MGARILEMGERRWEVFVNARPVTPLYSSQRAAMKRAGEEARTHHSVTVALNVGKLRPRIVATWVNGKKQK